MKVFLATQNQNKVKEYRFLLKNSSLKLLKSPKPLTIKEAGQSFRENAIIKVATYGRYFNTSVLADDSGLVISSLNGFPGIKTNRFARGNYSRAMAEIIRRLAGKSNRQAKFVCCLAFYQPGRKIITFTGEAKGLINLEPKGKKGFGFDPIFYYPPLKKTFAQMSLSQKNLYSHRAKALAKLIKWPGLLKTRQ
ncbi:MAG: RdgB/HAM1 family non-canonical purine NTP pyrophosphatase [Candidatus Beckwithbacteria bacterium]|nr:RdgB/HAM1 family non-canonical purine NTP pyrophosphatase [Candidatus Beckwithbacteria bacterium]